MRFFFLSFILVFFNTEASAFDLEKYLRRNSSINSLINRFEKEDEGDSAEASVHIKSLTDKISEITKEADAGKVETKIELVDYETFEVNECPNCSSYLSLSDDVTKILNKMESLDETTKKFIDYQANSVKFLSYQVRKNELNNQNACSESFGISTYDFNSTFTDLALVHSDVVNLPNFSSLQYVDTTTQEVRFLYKINTHGKDQLVEMFIKDGKARVYYYDYNLRPEAFKISLGEEKSKLSEYWDEYKPVNNRFDLKINTEKTFKSENFNARINFDPDLILRDNKIPTDMKIATIKTETKLTEKSSVDTTSEINLTKQSLEAVFRNDDDDFLRINATNSDLEGQKLIAIVPLKVSLNEKTGLSLNASIKKEERFLNTDHDLDNKEDRLSDETVSVMVKDKDNQYVNLTFYNNNRSNYQSLMASNRTKINDRNTVSAQFKTDTDGARDYSFSHSISFYRYGNLTTTYGVEKLDENSKETDYFKIDHSMRVGKRSTLGIEAKTAEGELSTVFFKFQSRN